MDFYYNKYGLLCYENSYNLGDEIQSIAAKNLLPKIDVLIDRDSNKIKNICNESEDKIIFVKTLKTIYNGWFDGQYAYFPPISVIDPLFVSFHINETDHSNDKMYDILEKSKIKFKPIASNIEFFKRNEPIGCRDLHTTELLKKHGIDAYFSGCLTLTLQNKFTTRTDEILVVDAHIMCPELFKNIIPKSIKDKAIYITQAITEIKSHDEKMILAQKLLDRYAQAKLVITSRLHTAMPCLAFGTPVILLHNDLKDIRFSGLKDFVKAYTHGDQLDIDLETYQNKPNEKLQSIIENIRYTVNKWIGTDDHLNKTIKEGKSIFSVCMNRNTHLEITLPTWIAANPNEIVIVDWGSKVPIKPIIDKYNTSGIIKLIRVENVDKWVLTKSFNLAARFTSYKNILKLDCDSILDATFFNYHNINENIFFAGNWTKARNDNEKHTNGIVYMRREDFFKIGGYNEYITTYGYDDCDLYKRLEKHARRLIINLDTIKHFEHTYNERTENQVVIQKLDVEIEKNRLISELYKWDEISSQSESEIFSKFEVIKFSDSYYNCKYLSSLIIDEDKEKQCLEKAIKNREYVTALKLKNQRKRLYINVKNGLGNRMRALASAYNIAKNTNRQLVLIWIPDSHCYAKFTDLFKINYLMKDVIIIESEKELEVNGDTINYIINENDFIVKDKVVYNYMKHKDKYIDDTTEHSIYIVSACVLVNKHTNWNKEAIFLRYLEIKDNIAEEIFLFDIKHNINNAIGVHIRMGQSVEVASYENISDYSEISKNSIEKWRKASDWKIFLNEMDNILKNNPKQMFFVCCDNKDAYDELLKIRKNNIVYYEKQVYDRSVQQIIYGLIDVVLLSKTKYILGSNWSSFTELAHRLSGNSVKLAGVHF
jgi:hypothetical protein